MRSKRDLATAILRKLTVCSLADEPAPEDSEKADEGVLSCFHELVTENLITFNFIAGLDSEVIPDAHYYPLLEIAAYDLAPNFGKSLGIEVREMGLKRLRRAVLQGYDPTPVTADYF